MPHRANLRSISSAVRRAQRPKFAFYLSRDSDFQRRMGDISPPGEVLSKDGKYPKILGSSSSQSPLRSERPSMGIPRYAPLLLLSHLNPLPLGFKWGPGECYRGRPPHPSSPTAMPPSPLWGEGLLGAFYRLPPSGGKKALRAATRGRPGGHRGRSPRKPKCNPA